ISVEEEENDPASILSMVKELIRLRHSYPALEKGEINFFRIYAGEENTDKEYIRAMAFVVYDESDYLLVIANLHEARELQIDVSGLSKIKEINRLYGPELFLERDSVRLHGTFAGQTVYLFELLF
ncbi:MAG: hypothetical protein JXB60_04745, partial [Candidatus Cloacimonetes bacterium]|nr:hypothetical protein [Candidatus Cloacimonadota bacterium]